MDIYEHTRMKNIPNFKVKQQSSHWNFGLIPHLLHLFLTGFGMGFVRRVPASLAAFGRKPATTTPKLFVRLRLDIISG